MAPLIAQKKKGCPAGDGPRVDCLELALTRLMDIVEYNKKVKYSKLDNLTNLLNVVPTQLHIDTTYYKLVVVEPLKFTTDTVEVEDLEII